MPNTMKTMIRVIARAVRTLRCAWPGCTAAGTERVGGQVYCPACALEMRRWAREATG